ncbi:hypothetical protein [Cohnella faecalis]|nr:hypothetical protein [Cohnella faecalis]
MSSQFEGLDFNYLREKANEDNPNLSRRLEDTIKWVKENTVD